MTWEWGVPGSLVRRGRPCPTSPPAYPIIHQSACPLLGESQRGLVLRGWALAEEWHGSPLGPRLGPGGPASPLPAHRPLTCLGNCGSAMTRVRAGRRPSRSAPAAVLSVPLGHLPQNPGVCPRGFQAWGDIGLEGKRAFSPKLLVLPGGVPLK